MLRSALKSFLKIKYVIFLPLIKQLSILILEHIVFHKFFRAKVVKASCSNLKEMALLATLFPKNLVILALLRTNN
jgi:hypothetical protein